MGTPEFAVPCLEKLIEMGHEVAAVVTQPDKPSGRKQSQLKPPPVKEAALSHGISSILQPVKVRSSEFADSIKAFEPDLIVTIAYGRILPKNILDIPRLGCINVHGSLLPKYRGAAPIQWAIINGESFSGITTMYMDEGMDTGDMLLRREVPITENMTYQELYETLEKLGAEVLEDTIERLLEGTLERIPQNHAEATTVPIMSKEMGQIDWSREPVEVHNLVRGTDPWPGAYTFYKGSRMKIRQTRLINDKDELSAYFANAAKEDGKTVTNGRIEKVLTDSLVVSAGNGFIKVTELQPESGKRMSVRQCGHNMDEGEIFG
ncbi:MAG: methionyl-tRNA formyltransferase [Clostridiales bacterium]|nr:methionyl-tRNA formyltransferase [Clostridiales bacterium]